MKKEDLDLLYDHYKDVHQHILHHGKIRDRMIMFTGIVLFLMCVQIYNPDYMLSTVSGFISRNVEPEDRVHFVITQESYEKLKTDTLPLMENTPDQEITRYIATGPSAIGFTIWILFLSLIIKYCYSDLHLTRLYAYIQYIEIQIKDSAFKDCNFIFSGEQLSHKIFKLNLAGKLLSIVHHGVFTILIVLIGLVKMYVESVRNIPGEISIRVMDWIVFTLLLSTMVLYSSIKKKIRTQYLPINLDANIIKIRKKDK